MTTREGNLQLTKILRTLVAISIVAGVTSILFYMFDTSDNKDKIRVEVVKYLLQLVVVIIIGGLVGGSIAYYFKTEEEKQRHALEETEKKREQAEKTAEQRRTQARARATTRTDYLNRVGNAYRSVKAARRALMADGLTTKKKPTSDKFTGAQAQLYREEMKHINEAQLALEGLKIEAERLPEFIPLGPIASELKKMESYLRRILLEYEENWPDIEADNPVVFGNLRWLVAFTGPAEDEVDGKSFEKDLAKPYQEVVKIVSRHLLENGTENQ
jgi:hypothetical protein